MTWLEKNSQLVSQRDQERRSNYFSVLNFFLPIFPLCFSILNNLLIMASLIAIMEDFVSRFFTLFSFCTPWNYPSNFWFADVFSKIYFHCTSSNETSNVTQILYSSKTPLDSYLSVLIQLYNICEYKILTGFCFKV